MIRVLPGRARHGRHRLRARRGQAAECKQDTGLGYTTAGRFWATVTRGLCGTAAFGRGTHEGGGVRPGGIRRNLDFPPERPGLVSPPGEKPPPRFPAGEAGPCASVPSFWAGSPPVNMLQSHVSIRQYTRLARRGPIKILLKIARRAAIRLAGAATFTFFRFPVQ